MEKQNTTDIRTFLAATKKTIWQSEKSLLMPGYQQQGKSPDGKPKFVST
jgi:hypothetical protein